MSKPGSERPAGGPLRRLAFFAAFGVLRLVFGALLVLPYRARIRLAGWTMAHVLVPLSGNGRVMLRNLSLAYPESPPEALRPIARAAADNIGRTIAEMWSGPAFVARVRDIVPEGPGVAALAAARAEGRPVILAGAHVGNYDAARAALIAQGYRVGGLFQPMADPAFNRAYVRRIEALGRPLFPRGREGMTEMIRFLRAGGMLIIMTDLAVRHGPPLRFFGRRAHTATTAADLALRYGADLIPFYGLRREDGLTFRIVIGAPVGRASPQEMMQALNDDVEAVVRAHPGQWLWVHRRWKAPRSGPPSALEVAAAGN
ncbi:MAG: lauroyl acyltransferase [Rhodobacteraceae bacterium]|nr:lauroyl acyltransferase [Paracoccaceae bacterium]